MPVWLETVAVIAAPIIVLMMMASIFGLVMFGWFYGIHMLAQQ